VGAGPAGLAAALQLGRQGVRTVLLEKGRPGGQVLTANRVENYLGLPPVPGAQLAALFVRQALRAGVRIVRSEALEIGCGATFEVRTAGGAVYRARVVVLATGALPRKLDGLAAQAEGKVRYDTDDLESFRDKKAIVLGGGDAALDRALRLKAVCSSIRVVSRGSITALPALVDDCRRAGVKMVQDAGKWDVRQRSGGLSVRTGKGNFLADMVLASIGKEPHSPLLPRPLEELRPSFPCGETTLPGLYVIGDLAAGRYRQLSVATGMGVASAMHAGEYLKRRYGVQAKGNPWK